MGPRRLLLAIWCVAVGCGFDAAGSPGIDAGLQIDAEPGGVEAIALYELDEGAGTVIRDTSGVAPAVDLVIESEFDVLWVTGALDVLDRAVIKSSGPATKISNGCIASTGCAIEVWVTPANNTQAGPARIVSLGIDEGNHNFMVCADGPQYCSRYRTTDTDSDGDPQLSAPGTVQTDLTHVVVTLSPAGKRRFYVDAVLHDEDDFDLIGSNTTNWDNSHSLALANEVNDSGTQFWRGRIHRLAILRRPLTGQQVYERFLAGPD